MIKDDASAKPSKTREELESAIRLEMEDISDWPTDLANSVVPQGRPAAPWKIVNQATYGQAEKFSGTP